MERPELTKNSLSSMAPVVAELQVVRAVGCECCVSELDGIRVELARGDAVDVDGRVRLIARDPEGDRVDAGRELDGFGHLLPRVIAACRIEVHVLDELLRGLTHIEDHLVVGGVVILSGVARHKRYGAALAGGNREGDGVAALVEVARVGGDDLRFVRRLVARALQVGGDLLVCFVVVPELGVDVRGRGWADLALRHGMAVPARPTSARSPTTVLSRACHAQATASTMVPPNRSSDTSRTKFFRGQDWQTFESFKADLDAYITHWNTTRRQVKLKGLTPAEYRDQALQEAA